MRPILKAAGLLALLVAGFYWKLTATSEYIWMDNPDLTNQVLPWWNYEAREWHQGRLPLWEPHQWAGQPLIGQAQPGAAYPLNWLLFLTPLKDGKLRQGYLDVYYVSERFLAAFNCFLLCWYLRRSWWASIVAGCVFGLGGFVGNMAWPQMVNGAVWIPLVLLFTLRAARERTALTGALGGFFLGLAWLSGHHQVPIFLTYTVAGMWLWMVYRAQVNRWALLRPAAVTAAFLAMTAALQVLPAYEYGRLAVRWVGGPAPVGWKDPMPYEVHATYSLKPDGVLGLFLPPFTEGFVGYIGAAALLLGIAGVLLAWRHPRVRGFAWLAGIALVVALGANTPLQGWAFAWLPMFDKARSPAAAISIFNAGFAPLVAFGLDAIPRRSEKLRDLWRTAIAAGAVILVLFLAIGTLQNVPSIWIDQRLLVTAFCLFISAGLLARSHAVPRKKWILAFLALILVENTSSSTYRFTSKYFPRPASSWFRKDQHDDIAAYLRAQPGPIRVNVDERVIPYNFGDYHGIDTSRGYLASLTQNLREFKVEHPKFQQALGITHEISDKPMHEGGTEVYRGKSGLQVDARPDPFPRVWTVHSLRSLPTAEAANAWLDSPEADLRTTGFVVGAPVPKVEAACGDDAVRLLQNAGGLVDIQTEMACQGVLVLSDIYFPGWKAAVDGRDAGLFAVDGLLRGVVVSKGRHHVEMRYMPWTVTVGATLLGLSVIGLAALGLLSARQP